MIKNQRTRCAKFGRVALICFAFAVVICAVVLFSLTIKLMTLDLDRPQEGVKSCQALYLDFTYLQVALFGFLSLLLILIMCKLFSEIN